MAGTDKPPQPDPKPAFSGAVDVGADTGKGEATLLSAYAATLAAKAVGDAVRAVFPAAGDAETRLFIHVGDGAPGFEALTDLQVRIRVIVDGLGAAAKALDAAAHDAHRPHETRTGHPGAGEGASHLDSLGARVAPQSIVAPVIAAAAGLAAATQPVAAALQAVLGLGALFQSDYALGGIAVTPQEALLGAAVAGDLAGDAPGRVFLPARAAPTAEAGGLADLLTPAFELSGTASGRLAALRPRLAGAQAVIAAGALSPPGASPRQVAAAGAVAGACEQAIGAWERVIAAVDDLMAGLAKPDDKGATAMARVAGQMALSRLMRDSDFVLFLQLGAAVGGYVVARNALTVVTGVPVRAMGGVVASYTLVRRDTGAVLRAGVVPVSSGYVKLTEVDETLDRIGRTPWWARPLA